MDKSIECRFCKKPLRYSFVDLGKTPLSNSFLREEQLNNEENCYPLHAFVCENCYLVQLPVFESPEKIFGNYAYFSSYSDSWLTHARNYTELMIQRFGYGKNSLVIEIASNDGYLLQYFRDKFIPVLGIEPAENVADLANKAGIRTIIKFFGVNTAIELASQDQKADLLIGNNVLAHVPDLNDFVRGIKMILKEDGVATLEFPHLVQLVSKNQFDTIYHEHFSYFSFITVTKVFAHHGLTLFDVEELATHGGSLRIYARHSEDKSKPVGEKVQELLNREKQAGITSMNYYLSFSQKVMDTKNKIKNFFHKAKAEEKKIAGYGAPAKGNTLLNYCGLGKEFIKFTVDKNPHKQGLYLPGTHIPILHPDTIRTSKPDYLLILPWNLKEEIMDQMSCIREWNGNFVVLIPEPWVY
jgi:SAM-dependent methyltransferase